MDYLGAILVAIAEVAKTVTSLVSNHQAEIAAKDKIIADLKTQLANLPPPPKMTRKKIKKES